VTPKLLPNGNILIPLRAEGEHGEVGHGAVEIGPKHPDYGRWRAELDRVTAWKLKRLREMVRPAPPEDRLPEGRTVVTFFQNIKRPGSSKP
jgi:hypothetical protein